MSKLLIIGLGPLLESGVRYIGAQCLRTWFFAKPLIDDGHEIRLVTLPIFDPNNPAMHQAALLRGECEGFPYDAFTNTDDGFVQKTLAEITASFQPDAILGINIACAWHAARLPSLAPLWADLNGYEMTEKQGQAARTGSDDPLLPAWKREALVARRADKFSAVSRPQLHALLGELAFVGRLNQHTFHYHFAHHIPEAYHPLFSETAPSLAARQALRGTVVPDDAFVLLWSGGYNYWTDPAFLFQFLESAMAADNRIHFVSTGGAIEGYNSSTYDAFASLVAQSPHGERYHLLGWVPAEELPAIYREADLGINIDEPNYETLFGARNRLNNMMAMGLPVLTTRGSEISQMIEEWNCGVVCAPGDARALAEGALRLVREPQERKRLAERAARCAREEFSAEKTTAAARAWAKAPALAPDNAEKLRRNPRLAHFSEASTNYLEEQARIAETCDLASLQADYLEVEALRTRWWYRSLKGLKDAFIAPFRPQGLPRR